MNQKHVPSMELCQQFVDLCSKNNITLPETEFYWVGNELLSSSNEDDALKLSYVEGLDNVKSKPIPSPLVSELGEFLPDELADEHQDLPYFLTAEKRADPDYWIVYYGGARGELSGTQFEGNTEANARQSMINYLIAEGIITTL